ncbi:MAG: M48 family metallopeptidase [Candidatus Izemoplasmataceae bacterium]
MNSIGYIILSFIVAVSLIDIGIEYLHIKRYREPIPEEMKDLYAKVTYGRYIKKEKRIFLFSMIKSAGRIIIFFVFSVFGLFLSFSQNINHLVKSPSVEYLLFIGGFFGIIFMFDMLLEYIEEFVYRSKKKSKKNITTFFVFLLKRFGIVFGLGGVVIFLMIVLYDVLGFIFFFILLVFIESIVVLFSLFFTKLLVLFVYKLKPLEEGELKEQIQVFLRQEGYQIEDVYVLNQGNKGSDMNAFVSGFSSRKRIVLFESLVKKLTNDEIVAVIAHELGHQKYGHILYNMALSFFLVSGFVFGLGLLMSESIFSTSFGFDSQHIGFSILLYIYLLDGFMMLARFGLSYNSRRFEYQADHYAATVWYKESLKNALIKITKRNIEHLTPHPIYAMIYFTHPSLVERLKKLNEEEYYE